jgi:chemotaxis methyl-accepting protein methylase
MHIKNKKIFKIITYVIILSFLSENIVFAKNSEIMPQYLSPNSAFDAKPQGNHTALEMAEMCRPKEAVAEATHFSRQKSHKETSLKEKLVSILLEMELSPFNESNWGKIDSGYGNINRTNTAKKLADLILEFAQSKQKNIHKEMPILKFSQREDGSPFNVITIMYEDGMIEDLGFAIDSLPEKERRWLRERYSTAIAAKLIGNVPSCFVSEDYRVLLMKWFNLPKLYEKTEIPAEDEGDLAYQFGKIASIDGWILGDRNATNLLVTSNWDIVNIDFQFHKIDKENVIYPESLMHYAATADVARMIFTDFFYSYVPIYDEWGHFNTRFQNWNNREGRTKLMDAFVRGFIEGRKVLIDNSDTLYRSLQIAYGQGQVPDDLKNKLEEHLNTDPLDVLDKLLDLLIDASSRVSFLKYKSKDGAMHVASSQDNFNEGRDSAVKFWQEYKTGLRQAAGNDEARSGGMKSLGKGIEWSEKKLEIANKNMPEWRKYAKTLDIQKKVIKGKEIIAKFIDNAKDIPDGLYGYHFYDEKGNLVIVTNTEYYDEAIFHEAREAYWHNRLTPSGEYLAYKTKKDINRTAHILASAEQSLAFSEYGNLTPFHEAQINNMDIDALMELFNEFYYDREWHRENYGIYLGKKARSHMMEYETLLFRKVVTSLLAKGKLKYIHDCIPRTKKSNTLLSKAVREIPIKDLERVMKEVGDVGGVSISTRRELKAELTTWFDRQQLMRVLALTSANTILEKEISGDIKSYISFGGYRLYHPIKAVGEYIGYANKKNQTIAKRIIRTLIGSLKKKEFYDLIEVIKQETGIQIDVNKETGLTENTIDQVCDICSSWQTVRSLYEKIGVSKGTMYKILEKYDIKTFVLSPSGSREIVLVPPGGAIQLQKLIDEFLQGVKDWHKENIGSDISLENLNDFREWIKLTEWKAMFPFLGSYAFENYSGLKRYLVEDNLFVSPGYYIPHSEAQRLKEEVIGWLKNETAFSMLKKHKIIPEDMDSAQLTYEYACKVIMTLMEKWMTIEQFSNTTGMTTDSIRRSIQRSEIDCIKLNMFQAQGIYYFPPGAKGQLKDLDFEANEQAKKFLQEVCGISIRPLDDIKKLLKEHCMTSAEIAKQLGIYKIMGASERPNTIVLKFKGTNGPIVYWKKQDAEDFIKQEKEKLKKMMEFVAQYSDVSSIKSTKDLVGLLESEWKSPKQVMEITSLTYSGVMNGVYSGKFVSVTVDLVGFVKRTYIYIDKATTKIDTTSDVDSVSVKTNIAEEKFAAIVPVDLKPKVVSFDWEGVLSIAEYPENIANIEKLLEMLVKSNIEIFVISRGQIGRIRRQIKDLGLDKYIKMGNVITIFDNERKIDTLKQIAIERGLSPNEIIHFDDTWKEITDFNGAAVAVGVVSKYFVDYEQMIGSGVNYITSGFENLEKIFDALNIQDRKTSDTNVTCGTICESGHEGSYEALDEQLKRQFIVFKEILAINEDRDLREEESDRALVLYAKGFGVDVTEDQIKEFRANLREAIDGLEDIDIFFSFPETVTDLFWVGEDYAGGHFNQAGTRIHISLPIILKSGINAGIEIARHELLHMQGKGHIEDAGTKIVKEIAVIEKEKNKLLYKYSVPKTYWGRDGIHLEVLVEKALEKLNDGEDLNIIMLGSSNGKLGYDIAMFIAEYMERTGRKIITNLIISDFDPMLVEIAQRGIYFSWSLEEPLYEDRNSDLKPGVVINRYHRFFSKIDEKRSRILTPAEFKAKYGINIDFMPIDILNRSDLEKAGDSHGLFDLIIAHNVHYKNSTSDENNNKTVIDNLVAISRNSGIIHTYSGLCRLETKGTLQATCAGGISIQEIESYYNFKGKHLKERRNDYYNDAWMTSYAAARAIAKRVKGYLDSGKDELPADIKEIFDAIKERQKFTLFAYEQHISMIFSVLLLDETIDEKVRDFIFQKSGVNLFEIEQLMLFKFVRYANEDELYRLIKYTMKLNGYEGLTGLEKLKQSFNYTPFLNNNNLYMQLVENVLSRLSNEFREEDTEKLSDPATSFIAAVKKQTETEKDPVILALDVDIGNMEQLEVEELLKQIKEVSGILGNVHFVAGHGYDLPSIVERKIEKIKDKNPSTKDFKVIIVTKKPKNEFNNNFNIVCVDDVAIGFSKSYVPILELLAFALILNTQKDDESTRNELRSLYFAISNNYLTDDTLKEIKLGNYTIFLPRIKKTESYYYSEQIEVLKSA